MSKIIVKFARKSHRPEVRYEHVAYHEAGHAVGGILDRQPFRYVTLRPHGLPHALGLVKGRRRRFTWPRSRAVICCMGPLAEARYQAVRHRCDELWQDALIADSFANGGRGDLEHAERLMGGFVEDQVIHLAERALDDTWPQVEAIAAALLERGTLTYAETLRIVGK